MKKILLSVRDLKKYFPLPRPSVFRRERPVLRAVESVSLDVYEGETYGLVGESGCGKSTFGRTLLGLYKPTAGEVEYFGGETPVALTQTKGKALRALRSDLQIIFQDPYSSLNPRMTVGRIIEEGVVTHGYFKKGSKECREYVLEMMEKCGLPAELVGRYPHQFSGGQRQRICIARALAVKPKFIVCDECVSALDVSIQSQILNLLSELKEKEKLTYLFISHDLSVVRYLSDRIGVMYLGQIVEWGNAGEVFDRPAHPYTVALLSAMPSVEGGRGAEIPLRSALPVEDGIEGGCPFAPRCFMAKEVCQRNPAPLVEISNGHFSRCHFAKDVRNEGK